ncbi:MAG: GFA family protein [Burkholderiales bacterium]|nr:GFA family protein [Burkholderiales bacterium]
MPFNVEKPLNPSLYRGACHCGAVKFQVRTSLDSVARCNCSLCRRKGALMSKPFAADQLEIVQGQDALTLYQFNTRTAKHFFCKHCGIYPFHQTRKDPTLWRVNIGCLEGVDPYSLEAGLNDGASLSVMDDA